MSERKVEEKKPRKKEKEKEKEKETEEKKNMQARKIINSHNNKKKSCKSILRHFSVLKKDLKSQYATSKLQMKKMKKMKKM